MAENASMISRSIPKVPEDPKELHRFLRKVLRDHYQDLHTLFSTCTDCDRYEKLQRDNE